MFSSHKTSHADRLALNLRDHNDIQVRATFRVFQAVEKVLAMPSGFYWQTVETDEKYLPNGSDIKACRHTDTEVK